MHFTITDGDPGKLRWQQICRKQDCGLDIDLNWGKMDLIGNCGHARGRKCGDRGAVRGQ